VYKAVDENCCSVVTQRTDKERRRVNCNIWTELYRDGEVRILIMVEGVDGKVIMN
jgi:hypothetical protein